MVLLELAIALLVVAENAHLSASSGAFWEDPCWADLEHLFLAREEGLEDVLAHQVERRRRSEQESVEIEFTSVDLVVKAIAVDKGVLWHKVLADNDAALVGLLRVLDGDHALSAVQ